MSDFDKEAEREKLREKYGKEEERREATEQMSELLLQGATMTNAHCSDCGDPIFRYDGTEFCPTCEKRVDRGDGADEGDDGGAADAGAAEAGDEGAAEAGEEDSAADDRSGDESAPDPRTVEVTSPSDDATVKFGGPEADADERSDRAEEGAADANADASTADAVEGTADAGASQSDAGETRGEPSADERPDPTADPSASGGTDGSPAAADPGASGGTDRAATAADASVGSGDRASTADRVPSLRPDSGEAGAATAAGAAAGSGAVDAAASESLQRARRTLAATVERFSRRALETDSPREAREYLETAREAAATLEATEF